MVSAADGVLVVLHHQQGVDARLERFEGVEQQPVVARMQADGRLVEDVAHAAQVGTELCGEPNALRLAARQGGRGAVQREVAEAHLVQEVEPAADLADQVAGDVGLARRQHELAEELGDAVHRPCRQLVDAQLAKAYRPRHRIEPRTGTGRAGLLALQLGFAEIERVRVIDLADGTQAGAVAARAPAVLCVVGEQPRIGLGEAVAAGRAGPQRREGHRPRVELAEHQQLDDPLAMLERKLQLLAQQRLVLRFHHHHAHRQLDVVFLVAIEARPLARRQVVAIHPELLESLGPRPLGEVGVKTLAADDERRQQLHRTTAEIAHDLRRDGLEALRLHRHLTLWAELGAELHIHQPQEGLDLGERRHGTLAAAAAGALLDGDGGRNAEDGVHIGPAGRLHELAGVGIERFEIASLAFAEDDVEGECGLAGTRQTGDHREGIARDLEADVLEVVLAGVADLDCRCRQVARTRFGHCQRAGRAAAHVGQLRGVFGERCAGVRAGHVHDLPGRSLGDHPAAAFAAFRAEVDEPVGSGDHVEVVLDHHQGVVGAKELLEGSEQS